MHPRRVWLLTGKTYFGISLLSGIHICMRLAPNFVYSSTVCLSSHWQDLFFEFVSFLALIFVCFWHPILYMHPRCVCLLTGKTYFLNLFPFWHLYLYAFGTHSCIFIHGVSVFSLARLIFWISLFSGIHICMLLAPILVYSSTVCLSSHWQDLFF